MPKRLSKSLAKKSAIALSIFSKNPGLSTTSSNDSSDEDAELSSISLGGDVSVEDSLSFGCPFTVLEL